MRAAVFQGPGKDLEVEDVPEPTLNAGEVLIRTAACGVCATDLHYMHGTPTFKKPPIILGHEVSGVVEKVSDGVAGYSGGERVLVPAVLSCGDCGNCREGRDNICERMSMVGNHVDGGFAEFMRAPARMLFKLPAELPLQESAVISDAMSTPFHAVKNRGMVRAGEWVAIFGCGGVGINAVQIAAAFGANVVAVDVDDRKLELARQLGASAVFNSKQVDAAKEIRGVTDGGGVDAAFEVVGKPEVQELALRSVKTGGRLVTVGSSERNWDFKVSRVMFRELTIIGSLGCRSAEYPRIIEMARSGKLKLGPVVSEKLPLQDVNGALKRLEAGTVIGRQVVTFG